MTNKKTGRRMIKIAALLLSLLVITAYVEAAEQQVVMEIEGMTCDLCSVAIKKALEEIRGVRSVKVSFEDS